MYELIKIGERSYYIDCPAKMGLIASGDSAVLIDSGNDKQAGKKALKIIEENGFKLSAILNTHSHADHIGGNKFLQDRTGCRIFAPGIECAFTRHTILESTALYGGFPPPELRHKFLFAQESDCEYLTDDCLPSGVSALPLQGHSFDMTGFMTDDKVAYIADCLSSRETLEKYKIGVIWDIAAYLETLERVKTLPARIFVPAHAAPTDDIAPLADYNISCVNNTAELILDICREPRCFDTLLREVFNRYDITLDFEQYALVGSTVRSYISYLIKLEKLCARAKGNILLFETA